MSARQADGTRRQPVRTEPLAPYRALALRVITLAVRDLVTCGRSTSERDSARTFLSGSHMLAHWCTLADIDPVVICRQVRGLVENERIPARIGRH